MKYNMYRIYSVRFHKNETGFRSWEIWRLNEPPPAKPPQHDSPFWRGQIPRLSCASTSFTEQTNCRRRSDFAR